MSKVKIYYHHTDSGGVVYYANYLKFLEEARTEFFAQRGSPVKDLAAQGVMFVVARQEIDYRAPAFYGDELEVKSWISEMSSVKIIFDAEIKNQEGRLLSVARTVLVCVDKGLRPKAIPEELRKKWMP